MRLSRKEVEHIALLARVGLTEEDVERFRLQLSNILENFQALQEVDTEGVPPTSQSIPLLNVLAQDEVCPSCDPAQIMANAPRQEDGFFRVLAVLE